MRLGDFYESFLESKLNELRLTRRNLSDWEPPATTRGRGGSIIAR
jgi:hypothetical protein